MMQINLLKEQIKTKGEKVELESLRKYVDQQDDTHHKSLTKITDGLRTEIGHFRTEFD